MEKYSKVIKNNKIIFIDKLHNKKLTVNHFDDKSIFDTIYIDETYDINFLDYIIKELIKTDDINSLYLLNNNLDLKNIINNNGFKISHYQYKIKYNKTFKLNYNYEITNTLDNDSKKYYLKMINNFSKQNNNYLELKEEVKYDENWLNNRFNYRVYKLNKKIVGILDYNLFNENEFNINSEIFNYNNKLCIRCLFGKSKEILLDIIKDLLNVFKKDIIISFTPSEKNLEYILNKSNLNSKFDYCLYILFKKY